MIDVYFNMDYGKIKNNSITKKYYTNKKLRDELFQFFWEQNPILNDHDFFYNNDCVEANNPQGNVYGSFKLQDDYLTGNSRKKKYDSILNTLYSTVDQKVNKSMTDAEKAVIISEYCTQKFKYNANERFLFPALQSGKGNCQVYSRLFNLLARRYNLSSIYLITNNHALNGVCIDNKLYYVDCTNQRNGPLKYFCSTYYDGVYDSPFFPKKYLGLDSIRSNLFNVYKDNIKVGVYYDLDSVLKDIVVSENSNYRIELGYKGSFSSSVYASTTWQATVEKCNCKSLTFKFGTEKGSLKINQELMKNTNVIIENEIRCTII